MSAASAETHSIRETDVNMTLVNIYFIFVVLFRSVGEVACGETASRREELPRLLSALVWSLR